MTWNDQQKYAFLMNLTHSSRHIQMSANVWEASWSRLTRRMFFKKKNCREWGNFSISRINKLKVKSSSNSLKQILLWSRLSYKSTQISMKEKIYIKRQLRTTLVKFLWFVSQLKVPIWPSTTLYTQYTATSMWLSSLASFKKTRSLIIRWSSYLCLMAKLCPLMPF